MQAPEHTLLSFSLAPSCLTLKRTNMQNSWYSHNCHIRTPKCSVFLYEKLCLPPSKIVQLLLLVQHSCNTPTIIVDSCDFDDASQQMERGKHTQVHVHVEPSFSPVILNSRGPKQTYPPTFPTSGTLELLLGWACQEKIRCGRSGHKIEAGAIRPRLLGTNTKAGSTARQHGSKTNRHTPRCFYQLFRRGVQAFGAIFVGVNRAPSKQLRIKRSSMHNSTSSKPGNLGPHDTYLVVSVFDF